MPVGRIQFLHLGPLTFREFLAAVDPAAVEPVDDLAPDRPPTEAAHRRLTRRGNAEVDYVISHRGWIMPIEVKAGRSGSLKSLLQFVHEKRPPVAVRFDANPPSLQTVSQAIRTAEGTEDMTARILSLPLYAVEALPRLLRALRPDAGRSARKARSEHPTD